MINSIDGFGKVKGYSTLAVHLYISTLAGIKAVQYGVVNFHKDYFC